MTELRVIGRDDSLSTRIRGITLSLESGDGGVRRDLDAALAEVDALEAQAANYRGAVERIAELEADLERERLARRIVDQALREALARDAIGGQ